MTVGCGDNHSVLVMENGKIYSFGSNDYGQLGHHKSRTRAGYSDSYIPKFYYCLTLYFNLELVEGLDAHVIADVACGSHHTLVKNEWGEIFAWGSNSKGQLGFDTQGQIVPIPKMIKTLATKHVIQIACGQNHSLALTNGEQT